MNFQIHPLQVLNNEFSSEEIVSVLGEGICPGEERVWRKDQPLLQDAERKQKAETRGEESSSLVGSSQPSQAPCPDARGT